jgi:peptidoglycan/LPS O-acetylase OafA/YrhL
MSLPAPPIHSSYLSTPYYPALDGLRAVSIVMVIWHHCWLTPPPGIWGKGPAGVQLFFVISGYLVTTLLLRERDRVGQIALGAFYLRRTLRIFPLYYAVLGVLTVHAALGEWFLEPSAQRAHFFRSWPYFATFTCNWWVDWSVPHPITFAFAWSLAIEEQFYAFWAPALRWLRGLLLRSGSPSALPSCLVFRLPWELFLPVLCSTSQTWATVQRPTCNHYKTLLQFFFSLLSECFSIRIYS